MMLMHHTGKIPSIICIDQQYLPGNHLCHCNCFAELVSQLVDYISDLLTLLLSTYVEYKVIFVAYD